MGGESRPPFGLVAGDAVSVALVNTSFFGFEVCGGCIGGGSTFCMQIPGACSIGTHRNKVTLEELRAGSKALVIRAPGKDPKAFASPVLDPAEIQADHLEGMLKEFRGYC